MAQPTLRLDIESLQVTPGGLDALQEAYTKMQAAAATDKDSWLYLAGYHGYPQFFCKHQATTNQPDLFLPWHRAYMLYFENAAKDFNAAAALPWWDWTSQDSQQNGIPTAFQQSPFNSGPTPPVHPPGGTTRSTEGALPTAADVATLLTFGDYSTFSSRFFTGIHTQVHHWVGGDMKYTDYAAFDPIFWSHHCMVDRIWYLWQQQYGVNNIPESYLNVALPPFQLTVAQVLSISDLGYSYAQSANSVEWPHGSRDTEMSGSAMRQTWMSPPRALVIPGTPASGKVVLKGILDGFRRADLVLEGTTMGKQSFEGRIFLDNPTASLATPIDPERGYAGSFYVFGDGPGPDGMNPRGMKVPRPFDPRPGPPLATSIPVDVTKAIQQVRSQDKGEITVTVVPNLGRSAKHYPHKLLAFERLSIITYL
jgi:tyrosinase